MTLRSLLINGGSLAAGALFSVVLHAAGMPPALIAISAVLVASAVVVLAAVKTRVFNQAPAEDKAADGEEVSA